MAQEMSVAVLCFCSIWAGRRAGVLEGNGGRLPRQRAGIHPKLGRALLAHEIRGGRCVQRVPDPAGGGRLHRYGPPHYDYEKEVEQNFRRRFTFGKWETGAAEYAGRRARTYADRVLIDQAKYIREQVHPIPLEKHRKQDKKASLNSLGGVLSRCSRRATSHLSPSIAAGARVANTVREAPACGAIGCFSSCATEHRGGWHL